MLHCSNNQLGMPCMSIYPIHFDMYQTHMDVCPHFQWGNNDQEDIDVVYRSLHQIYNNIPVHIRLLVQLSHLLHSTSQVCMSGSWKCF